MHVIIFNFLNKQIRYYKNFDLRGYHFYKDFH